MIYVINIMPVKKKIIYLDLPFPKNNKASKIMEDIHDDSDYKNNDVIIKEYKYDDNNMLVIRIKEEIWIKAKDVTEILEYKDTKKAIKNHIEEEDRITWNILSDDVENHEGVNCPLVKNSVGKNLDPRTVFINQEGLFELISRSRMEQAKEFRRWISKSVLPSIFKNGTYSRPIKEGKLEEDLEKYDFYKNNSLSSYENKNVIYIAYIGEHQDEDILKFGISSNFPKRDLEQHRKNYDIFKVLYIKESNKNNIIESKLKKDLKGMNMLRKLSINKNNNTELIALNEKYGIEWCIKKIDNLCKTSNNEDPIELEHIIELKDMQINDLLNQLQLKDRLLESKDETIKYLKRLKKTINYQILNK
jgi:prophage antirepressor-like protein